MGTTNDSRSAGIAISESLDEGHTWQHSVVKRAPENCTFATGPVAIVEKSGFIFRAMEMWCNVYQWPQSYQSLVLGASIGSNLTDPESWALSPAQGFKESFIPSWMPRPVISGGFLEGNAVPMRGGGLGVLLRCRVYDVTQRSYTLQHACLFEVDNWRALGGGAGADTSDVNLVWQGFVDMPGGGNKFTVRYDEPSDLYLALSNPSIDRYGKNPDARNILTLIYSRDLLSWRIAATVDMPDDGLPWDASLMQTSFMYVDWRVDGDDLLLAIRTAFDGARSFHDSNYITFKRLDKFRALLPPRAQPVEQSVA